MQVLDLFKLTNKVAVLTGGAGFLGWHFGKALAEAGADVVLIDLNEKLCQERVNKLTKIVAKVMGIYVDIKKKMSVEGAIKKI